MAAFSDKGDVCSEPLCGMRDFLPFNCNKCNKVFCVDHYAPDKHNCSRILAGDRRVYVCPTCLEAVPMRNEEVEEAAARRHRPQCQPDKYEERRRQLKGSTCPIKGCRERLTEITTYQCKLCNQSVCLKHRLQEDHDCQRVQQARKEKQQRSRGFRLFGSSTSSIAAKPASSSVGKEPARASSKQQVCQVISSTEAVHQILGRRQALREITGGTPEVGYSHREQVTSASFAPAQSPVLYHNCPPGAAPSVVLSGSRARSSFEGATSFVTGDSRGGIAGISSPRASPGRVTAYRAAPSSGYSGLSNVNSVERSVWRDSQKTPRHCVASVCPDKVESKAVGRGALNSPFCCRRAGAQALAVQRKNGAALRICECKCIKGVARAFVCTPFRPACSGSAPVCASRESDGAVRSVGIASEQVSTVMRPSVRYCWCPIAMQRSSSKSKSRCVIS